MKYANINLSKETLEKLYRSNLLDREEYGHVLNALRNMDDEYSLKSNQVNEVPIPKGFVAYPNK